MRLPPADCQPGETFKTPLEEKSVDRSLKLLLIEDSEDDALLLIHALKREGFNVQYQRVESPQGMAAALETDAWDVIISDYQMPHFTGLAALSIYQAHLLDIPFIIVSGAIGEETAVQVMKAGAHDYLLKDNLARLGPAIERELHEAAIRRERREAQQELRRSEARYRAIVEDQTELIHRTTLDGTITFVNQAYARLHEKQPEELIGTKHESYLPRENIERLRLIRSKLCKETPVLTSESLYSKSDGETIWIQWRDRLIFGPDGEPIEYQGVGRDITDLKLA